MEIDVVKYFITQGPFAVLFVWLFFVTRKESMERERELQKLLFEFSRKYDIIIDKLEGIERRIPENK